MAKVLWISDAGCTTGFSTATHAIAERLVEDYGHEVSVLAVNYRGDSWPCYRHRGAHVTPLRLYRPDVNVQNDIYGRSRIIEMLAKVEPDVVVFLADPQIVLQTLFDNEKFDPERILLRYRPLISYIPVDGIGLPMAWTTILTKVTNVVAMSRFGQEQYPGSALVYHGIDTDLWWPISERPKTTSTGVVCKTKADCKRAVGIDPDHFLVGRIDTNSGRKDYPTLVKALWPLMKKYDDIDVWFHCADDAPGVGIRFQAMFSREPSINPTRFHFPGLHNSFEGWPQQDINVLVSAFDVFVTTSRGEGFGLNLGEASACGIPIIAQNVSAMPEVVGPGGILLEPRGLITTPAGEDNWLPDPEAFTEAIERTYFSKGLRRTLGEAGIAHVRESFSWDHAGARFDEFITALAAFEPPVTSPSESPDAVLEQL